MSSASGMTNQSYRSPWSSTRITCGLSSRVCALSGIAFDSTGRFGHRLLVTAGSGGRTTVFGIGCDGRLSTVAAGAPVVEDGIVVAPATFGGFGGDVIAPDENGVATTRTATARSAPPGAQAAPATARVSGRNHLA